MSNQNRTNISFYLIGIGLVIIAAWWRYLSTGSIQVDNNPITSPELYPILFLFFSGIILNFLGYLKFVRNPNIDFKQIKSVAIAAICIATLMPPMLSNDVMLYLANGDLLNQGIVTYVDTSSIKESKFVDSIAKVWLDCPNHYGPFLLLIFGISTWLGKSLVGSMIIFKIITGLSAYAFVQLVFLFLEKQNINFRKYNIFALIVLAPVFWLQAVGQMHVDGIIMTLIMGMIYFLHQKKWFVAAALTAFVILSKIMYAAVFIPFFFIYVLYQLNFDWSLFFKKSFLTLSFMMIICFGFYAPFWEGSETIMTSINYHESKPPSRSHVEVLTDVIFYAEKLSDSNAGLEIETIATNDDQLHNNKLTISKPLTSFFKIFGILIAGWVFLGLGFIKNKKELLHIFGKIILIVLCFYSPIFHPWYFLLALPFFVFTEEKSWVFFIAIVFSFSNLHEIGFSIPRSSPLYLATLPFVLFMVISFFIYFKKHFIEETWNLMKENEFVGKEKFKVI